MADLSSLSDDELISLASSKGLLDSPESGFDSFLRGVQESPEIIASLPRGIYELGGNVVDTLTLQADKDKSLKTLEAIGTMGAGTAGGVSGAAGGAALGSVLGPAGTVAGGIIGGLGGGSLASRGYEYLIDLIQGEGLPTKQKVTNDLAYDAGSGGVIDLATFGVGRGSRSALGLFDDAASIKRLGTDAGKKASAARALRKLGIDESALAKVDADDLRSIGEQLQDPDIARIEKALDREYASTAGAQANELRAERADMRSDLLSTKTTPTKQDAGALAYDALEKAKGVKSKAVSKAYKAVPGDTVLDISPVINKIDAILSKRLGDGSFEKLNPTVEKIVLDLIDNSDSVTVERLNNYRKILGNELDYSKPNDINKVLAKDIRSAIDEASSAADTGLGEAVAARREMGQQFEQGAAGKILKRGKYGERSTLDSQVVGKALASPEAAQQYAMSAGPGGRQAIADYVISDIRNNVDADKLTAASRFYKNKASELESILTPEQFKKVTVAINDIDSQLAYDLSAKQASRAGSPTAQFSSDQAGLKKLLGADSGFIDKHPILTKGGGLLLGSIFGGGVMPFGGSQIGAGAGVYIAERITNALRNADTEIAGILHEALTNKSAAAALLKTAASGDTFAQGLIKQLDSLVERASELSGVGEARLGDAFAIPAQTVGEVGQENYEEVQRYNRVNEQANRFSEMSDAELLSLAREQGLIDSKKKEVSMTEKKVTRGSSQEKYEPIIRSAAQESGVSPRLLRALVGGESNFDPNAVGYETPETRRQGARAQGLGQLMPATAREQARLMGIENPDLKDPETNLRLSAGYLKRLLDMFDGDAELALTAYHSGFGTVRKLLEAANGNSLSDIINVQVDDTKLGPAGRQYAANILRRV